MMENMKVMILQTARLSTVLCLFVLTLVGCSKDNFQPKSADQRGAEMQQSGTMSQADYAKVDDLGHKTHQTHIISDADLQWTLNLLKTGTNPIVRARAMTVLSEIRPMSDSQKADVTSAIAPYLNSSNRLDSLSAQHVEKAVERK